MSEKIYILDKQEMSQTTPFIYYCTEISELTGVMDYVFRVSEKTDALGEEIREKSDALKHWVIENFDKQNTIYE